jgi:hypothetical protein
MENNQPENPYLKTPDPFEDYQDSIKKNIESKQSKEQMEAERLCHALFTVNPDGIALIALMRARFFDQSLVPPMHDNAANIALYWEGFRDCIRVMQSMANIHQQRMDSL